jgi:hypothetical protein
MVLKPPTMTEVPASCDHDADDDCKNCVPPSCFHCDRKICKPRCPNRFGIKPTRSHDPVTYCKHSIGFVCSTCSSLPGKTVYTKSAEELAPDAWYHFQVKRKSKKTFLQHLEKLYTGIYGASTSPSS